MTVAERARNWTRDTREWVCQEQHLLWHDLDNAIRRAINGDWSIEAANIARRIAGAARLTQPTRYGDVPWNLVAGGVYEALLRAGGVTPSMPDQGEWARLDILMARHGTRREHQAQLAGTVARIQDPRETRWILGVDE
jgi:hypothetical protein